MGWGDAFIRKILPVNWREREKKREWGIEIEKETGRVIEKRYAYASVFEY